MNRENARTITPLPSELLLAFEQLQCLQTEHHSAFSRPRPDFPRIHFERSQAVEELKYRLQLFLKTLNMDTPEGRAMTKNCQDRITSVLAQEEILIQGVMERKQYLKGKMQQLLKGRQALHGYGGSEKRGRPLHVSEKG